MIFLLIGSQAMARRGFDIPVHDVDAFSSVPFRGWDTFWHQDFEGIFSGCRVATVNELYTIKASHAYWELENGSWSKHMTHMLMLKRAGAALDTGLHDALYSVWQEKHGRKRVNLNMSKDEFFDDAVKREYDHDSIHYSVAYGARPLYEGVLVDGQEIAMDMAGIKSLDFDTQVRLFREEIYATALERWVIPSNYRISPRKAYDRALRRTITSLTKGWSATFIVDNFETFMRPDMDYVAHHKSKSHLLERL